MTGSQACNAMRAERERVSEGEYTDMYIRREIGVQDASACPGLQMDILQRALYAFMRRFIFGIPRVVCSLCFCMGTTLDFWLRLNSDKEEDEEEP